MRAREAAVIAVSEPENSAEATMQKNRIAPAIQMFIDDTPLAPCISRQAPARNSSSRKARTASGSMFLAMKQPPMPRARMKVSAPRFTFLSCAMAVDDLVGAHAPARDVADAGRQADGAQMRLDPLS